MRTGVVASKKIGKAVVRNKAKRRMRALLHQYDICADLVIVAKKGIVAADFTQLSKDFSDACTKIKGHMC